jgi:hypothetical protein
MKVMGGFDTTEDVGKQVDSENFTRRGITHDLVSKSIRK